MSSDMIRVTGMNSGLDTESIIKAYTSTATARVQDAKNAKTINEWTQDKWKDLNSKIYSFYSKTLSNNRMKSAYSKSIVKTSNAALSVVAGDKAARGVQNAKILSTASAAYLTGSKIDITSKSDNLMDKLGITAGETITFSSKSGDKTIQFGGTTTDADTKVVNTMDELVNAFASFGINANYDTGNQRIFLSAKETGENYDFELCKDGAGYGTLAKLGLLTEAQGATGDAAASKVKATNAELELNGAKFVSDSNTLSINGSTYTINYMPTDPDENISITTSIDYDGIYDVVKNMLKEYNSLINEMSKNYNAESADKYKPLSDEQKDEMTEKEIEEWENKIKGALLRNDDTLNGVMSAMTDVVLKGFEINGKTMYLSDFGISTQGYFDAEANERNALHIDGDPDDEASADKTDKLKTMIANDPDATADFFSAFTNALYNSLYSKMGSSSLSSIYKVYNDKQLKSENVDLNKKILELEQKVTDIEDKYYKKFATMETALAKLNSTTASMTGMFG